MTCESAKIVFVCTVIAFASTSLGNYVFLNWCQLYFFLGACGKFLERGDRLHLNLFYIPVFREGRLLRSSKLDIDHCVP